MHFRKLEWDPTFTQFKMGLNSNYYKFRVGKQKEATEQKHFGIVSQEPCRQPAMPTSPNTPN
jgi:hypothetical protein